jgi:hypothetical protein
VRHIAAAAGMTRDFAFCPSLIPASLRILFHAE